MSTIYKYQLANVDFQTVDMPSGAKILSAQIQSEQICLWALVDIERAPKRRAFQIHGTGHPVHNSEQLTFIDTVQLAGGGLIFHVFEVSS
jgi:hypothetical protein